jgi:hypothetical protein
MIAKLFDQMRVHTRRCLWQTQTAEEVEPLFSVGDEAHPPVPTIGRIVSMCATTNPGVGCFFDLIEADVARGLKMELFYEDEQMRRDEPERTSGASVCRAVQDTADVLPTTDSLSGDRSPAGM